jgi:hypothetical protein
MFGVMADDRLRLTRDELYALVWSEPMATLAPKYGLSDVGMAKICRKLRIPRPWRGYWARKDAGQKLKQNHPPLVDLENGAQAGVGRETGRNATRHGIAADVGLHR